MKFLFNTGIVLFSIVSTIFSQPVEIMVINTYKHSINEDGQISETGEVINQKTKNKKNQLIIEKFYDIDSDIQTGFTMYFYDTLSRVMSVENYDMNRNPVILKQIIYKENGDTLKIACLDWRNGDDKTETEKLFYYKDGKLVYTEKVAVNGNVIEKTKLSYKKKYGNRPVKIVSKSNGEASVKQKIIYTYTDTISLPVSKEVTTKKDNHQTRERLEYSYNSNLNTIKERYLKNNELVKQTIYRYAAEVELDDYYEEDGVGNKLAYYKVTYFWHNLLSLNYKSYFED